MGSRLLVCVFVWKLLLIRVSGRQCQGQGDMQTSRAAGAISEPPLDGGGERGRNYLYSATYGRSYLLEFVLQKRGDDETARRGARALGTCNLFPYARRDVTGRTTNANERARRVVPPSSIGDIRDRHHDYPKYSVVNETPGDKERIERNYRAALQVFALCHVPRGKCVRARSSKIVFS